MMTIGRWSELSGRAEKEPFSTVGTDQERSLTRCAEAMETSGDEGFPEVGRRV